eukprot:TRINITY_DN593_c0_g1_i1.p1 TRINITY_DN593_c0_g1~~TRINITY_DN593_c0_g1_i1.p1  ORF type:complete len:907 (+),score=254.78 TRINITY_DN593_c0_g1_i1:273-2723(+)
MPPVRPKDTIAGVLRKLERVLEPGSAASDAVAALVQEHQLDGLAMAEMDRSTLGGLLQQAGITLRVGKILDIMSVCRSYAVPLAGRGGDDGSSYGGSVDDTQSNASLRREAVQRVDYRVVWPTADTPALELLGLDSIAACGSCGTDRAASLTLPPRAQEILQIATAGAAHWRQFLADAPMTDSDVITAAVRALQVQLPEGAADTEGPHLPEQELQTTLMAKSVDLRGCGCVTRDVVESVPPTKCCVLRGPVAVPTIEDPSDGTPVSVSCFLRGVAGKALLGGAAFLGRRGRHTDREVYLQQGAHSVVFAQCTVVCGTAARAPSDVAAARTESVCSLTHCVFYDCIIVPCAPVFETRGAGRGRTKKGVVFVHGCLFIKCHWRPRAFSDWVVRDNCFINSTFLLRNRSMGDMTNNLVCAQAQQVEEGRLFIEEQKSRVRYRDNIFRGSIRTLGSLFFEDIANTYDVLPTEGVLRVSWSELENPTAIASGNFGVVYKARHRRLSQLVAVKELKQVGAHMDPTSGGDYTTATRAGDAAPADGQRTKGSLPKVMLRAKRAIEEMINEIEVMRGLHRLPNLIAIYGCGMHDEKVFMCMEYATHGCLQQLLRRRLPPKSAAWLRILHDIAVGLWSLHVCSPAIVHMDCRSCNVFVTDGPVCKLGDFGLALREAERIRTFPVRYCDPEVYGLGGHPPCAKPAHDMWGLGVLAWEVLEQGRLPYAALEVPDAVEEVRGGLRLSCPHACTLEGRVDLWERFGSRCFAPAPERPSAGEYAEQIGASVAEEEGRRALHDWIADEHCVLPTEVTAETEFSYVDAGFSFE